MLSMNGGTEIEAGADEIDARRKQGHDIGERQAYRRTRTLGGGDKIVILRKDQRLRML